MAEGFLRTYLGDRADVYSAGTHPGVVHPRAIQVMLESGIDISTHYSKHVDAFDGKTFDLVLTVCDSANENCPFIPTRGRRLHHSFPDPAHVTGTEEEIMSSFRHTRDLIDTYCRELANEADLFI